MQSPVRALIAAFFCIPLLACNAGTEASSPSPSPTPGPITTLLIEPADSVLRIVPPTPASVTFTATAVHADGRTTEDVTERVQWGVNDDSFGLFDGSTFTAYGIQLGAAVIRAHLPVEGIQADTLLYIQVSDHFFEDGVPPDAPDDFRTDGGEPPTLVYPESGTIVPPNLGLLDVHWLPGAGNTLFEIAFTNDATDIRVYTLCAPVGGGCALEVDAEAFEAVAAQNRGAMLDVTVSGVNPATGRFGRSDPREIGFSEQNLEGGIYYWAAGLGSIMRMDFNDPAPAPEVFYTGLDAGGLCVGCHTLSRDGTLMAVGANIPAPAALTVVDVATKTNLWSGAANFQAFSPDSSMMLWSAGTTLALADARTGAVLDESPVVSSGTMPDWSPDGTKIVYAASDPPCTIPFICNTSSIQNGQLYLVTVDPLTPSFGPVNLLAAEAGANYYYPSFSPDSAWVAFNRGFGDSMDNPAGELWMVTSAAPLPPIKLERADGAHGNSWPKWAPFRNSFDGEELMWLAFSSRRDFGLRLVNSTLPIENRTIQLWMAAVIPSRSGDPSFAAFRLPHQDIGTANLIPQWVEEVVRGDE